VFLLCSKALFISLQLAPAGFDVGNMVRSKRRYLQWYYGIMILLKQFLCSLMADEVINEVTAAAALIYNPILMPIRVMGTYVYFQTFNKTYLMLHAGRRAVSYDLIADHSTVR
jgi:hypothetical protein